MEPKKFVAYYRVSTKRQGESKAGLQAQQYDVQRHLQRENGELVADYTEIESGAKKDRPELTKALEQCKKHKAVLVIARLDRLARNVHFVACDMTQANKTMIQLMSVFAEWERDIISQRIKDALAQKKKQGVILGATGKDRARENKAKAQAFADKIAPIIWEYQADGITKICDLVRELNARQVPTANGGRWGRTTVYRLLERIA